MAALALVNEAEADSEGNGGTLLLFEPTGRNVQTVAAGVRDLRTASLNSDGMLTVMFERQRKYVLAVFDAGSLVKKSEQELTLPVLK